MSHSSKAILWFEEVGKADIASVGGKGVNQGVDQRPYTGTPGFIVTSDAYYEFLKRTGITDRIREELNSLDPIIAKQLQQVAEKSSK